MDNEREDIDSIKSPTLKKINESFDRERKIRDEIFEKELKSKMNLLRSVDVKIKN